MLDTLIDRIINVTEPQPARLEVLSICLDREVLDRIKARMESLGAQSPRQYLLALIELDLDSWEKSRGSL